MIASGWVWWTCAAGMKACSSVSIEERGAAGSIWQRARWATMSSSLISSSSNSGSTSSRRSGVKSRSDIVARSLPEPLTQIAEHLAADVVDGRCPWRRCCRRRSSRARGCRRADARRARPARASSGVGSAAVPVPVVRRRADNLGGNAHFSLSQWLFRPRSAARRAFRVARRYGTAMDRVLGRPAPARARAQIGRTSVL